MSAEQLFDGSPDALRAEFLFAVEAARAIHDPATEWSAFQDVLWVYLSQVFGVNSGQAWPEGLPDPAGGYGGDARAVADWMHATDEGVQRSAATPWS